MGVDGLLLKSTVNNAGNNYSIWIFEIKNDKSAEGCLVVGKIQSLPRINLLKRKYNVLSEYSGAIDHRVPEKV